MEPTKGSFDWSTVDAIETLREHIKQMNESDDPVGIVADLLMNGHESSAGYLTFGNNKIADNTGIFNLNSATDCPNAKTQEDGESETGLCQVPWKDCYAHKAENIYKDALDSRRRQQYLWDNVDAVTFAKALLRVKERKRSSFEHLRFSESGDFRHESDIIKAERIARLVEGHINVYTYSASHKLDWSFTEQMTVNQSNNLADYGDRLFTAVAEQEDAPDGTVICPFEKAKAEGVETDERPKCGECQLCINSEGPDVAVLLH